HGAPREPLGAGLLPLVRAADVAGGPGQARVDRLRRLRAAAVPGGPPTRIFGDGDTGMVTPAGLPSGVWDERDGGVTRAYPDEGCGVIFVGERRQYSTLACENASEEPAHGFLVGPNDMLRIAERLRQGFRLVAIYHSH